MFEPNLMIAPDVGGKIAKSFEDGQKAGMQNKARAAMAALVRDPSNQGALEALASVDPQAAAQFQQRQQEQAMAGLEQHREKIIMGAQIVRQMQPKDQAGWDQVRATAQRMGIDLADVPVEFNPQYVQGLVSVADAFKPQSGQQDPGIIREYQIAAERGLVPPGTTYQQYLQMRNPGMLAPVTIPENAVVEVPGGDNIPTLSTPEEAAKLPPGSRFKTPDGRVKMVPGGPTGSAPSGGFPR